MAAIVPPSKLPPPHITFVTGNPGKLAEMRDLLRPHGITVLGDAGGYPEIQADDLEAVAEAGARVVLGRGVQPPFLLEDAGLFIGALRGFPGVYSRHALETIGLDGVLRLMQDMEPEHRGAAFQACIAYVDADAQTHLFTGSCRGVIADRASGDHGFGFDPLFIPEGHGQTFAEMTPGEKGPISHRGRAAAALVAHLTNQ